MKKYGVGIANMWYGIGNTGLPNPSSAFVELLDDGTAIVLTGCADIGQGSDTVLAQIAAEELGIDIDDIKLISADTGVTPDAGKTSASRQTYISGNAVRLAAEEAKKVLLEEAAKIFSVSTKEVILENKVLRIKSDSDESKNSITLADCLIKCRQKGKLTLGHGSFNPDVTSLDVETGQGRPYASYAYATQIAEVEVDTETGVVNVLKVICAHDVGKAINPSNVIGQIEGGVVTGFGYCLLEEIIVQEGFVKNPNLATYLIPTSLDTPNIESIIIEDTEATGPFGAKGVGEPALIPTPAAIVNAIYDAVGVRITELPVTPEKLLPELKKFENQEEVVN
ncbi:MAG: xanthine dehydrogenase family protein molybdopterin-binding subunit [Peptococcaceae bacterium]